MPSAPLPPYCHWSNVAMIPALDGTGRLYSVDPARLLLVSVNCRYPGRTPGVGTGPLCTAGQAGMFAVPGAGVVPMGRPVKHVRPWTPKLGSATDGPSNRSSTSEVPEPVWAWTVPDHAVTRRTIASGTTPTRIAIRLACPEPPAPPTPSEA